MHFDFHPVAGRVVNALLIATATFLLTAGLSLAQASDSTDVEPTPPAIRVNFQPGASEIVCGYAPDFGAVFGVQSDLSYGWNLDHSDATRDRELNDDRRLDTLAQFRSGGMWEIALANGEHRVRVGLGDAAEDSSPVLNLEGVTVFDGRQLPAGQFREVEETVAVTDGKLTLDQGSAPDFATRINFIEIDASGTPEGCDEGAEEPPEPASSTPKASAATKATGVQPPTAPINVNFQPRRSPAACGYTPDRGKLFAERNEMTFGWNVRHRKRGRDRGLLLDQRKDTLIRFIDGGSWEIAVPNGDHKVRVAVGDPRYATVNTINVEGINFFKSLSLGVNQSNFLARTVSVRDGRLTIDSGKSKGGMTRINYVDVDSPRRRECKDTEISGEATESAGLPARPYGLAGLKSVFGKRCNSAANDGRAYFPSAGGRGKYGYVYFHSRLSNVVGSKILSRIKRKPRANDYGVWGYACRMKTGGTSWSVHSWGVAIDTNTLRNPFGQRHWNGRGSNGKRFGRFLPNIWMDRGFYWGLNFNDPMHFQYVSGY
ncbi:MAG: M15 family metallopeptidase [Actinomycetota bacterium]